MEVITFVPSSGLQLAFVLTGLHNGWRIFRDILHKYTVVGLNFLIRLTVADNLMHTGYRVVQWVEDIRGHFTQIHSGWVQFPNSVNYGRQS